MLNHYLRINYNLNSTSLCKKKGQPLNIDCNMEEKMDPHMMQDYRCIISWHYVAKTDSFIGNDVFDIIYLNFNDDKYNLNTNVVYVQLTKFICCYCLLYSGFNDCSEL